MSSKDCRVKSEDRTRTRLRYTRTPTGARAVLLSSAVRAFGERTGINLWDETAHAVDLSRHTGLVAVIESFVCSKDRDVDRLLRRVQQRLVQIAQ